MAQFESYKDCLNKVKGMNSSLPYKEAQKLASTLWAEQKEKENPETKPETKTITKPKSVSPALAGVIGEINNNASTINEVDLVLRNANINFYEIIKDGKDGANTKIYVKLTGGGRIPETGHFIVFC